MTGFMKEDRRQFTDFATVESQRNDLVPEEFPDGPYGSINSIAALGKSTPWRIDQRPPNPFSYENRKLHEGMARNYPPDHHPNEADLT